VRCGLFLHSPFPSSEIFRAFPKRDELLRSMLNADLVGEWPLGLEAFRASLAGVWRCEAF
jgi:trehalose-6-phosphate synthase